MACGSAVRGPPQNRVLFYHREGARLGGRHTEFFLRVRVEKSSGWYGKMEYEYARENERQVRGDRKWIWKSEFVQNVDAMYREVNIHVLIVARG